MEKNKLASDLKEACKALGLNYKDFCNDSIEIEKGVDTIDYKALYEEQKRLNEEIILSIGKLPNLFTDKFAELQKGFDNLNGELEILRNSPMHQRKSIDKVGFVEKSFVGGENGKKYDAIYDLKTREGLSSLKNYLGNKTMQELKKGISGGFYERAALALDAKKILPPSMVKELLEKDNILVQ